MAWKVCSALRDDEPIWSWQLSQQPGQEAKFNEVSDTQYVAILIHLLIFLFPLSFLFRRLSTMASLHGQPTWPAYMSQSFRATSRPGLAQIRTAQIPGRGTAGGGPTSAKAASQGLQRFTMFCHVLPMVLSHLVSV